MIRLQLQNARLVVVLAAILSASSLLSPGFSAQTAARTDSQDFTDQLVDVLTAEQMEAFLSGVAPSDIELSNGTTLAELIDQWQASHEQGLVFFPIEPCVVLDTLKSGQSLEHGEARGLEIRYSEKIGHHRCGETSQDKDARIALLAIQVLHSEGVGELKLLLKGRQPPDGYSLLQLAPARTSGVTVTAELCSEGESGTCSSGDIRLFAEGTRADIRVHLLGFYGPPRQAQVGGLKTSNRVLAKSLASPFWEAGTLPGQIYYSGGGVGFGTANPSAPVHIVGPSADYPSNRALTIETFGESPVYRDHVSIHGAADSGYGIAFEGDDHPRGGLYARNTGGTETSTGEMTLWANGGGKIRLLGSKIGIGHSNPQARLHVNGDVRFDIGEGLFFVGHNSYWGENLDARNFRIRDTGATQGDVDGGAVFEAWTEPDNQSFPILTLRRPNGTPQVGIGSAYPDGPLKIHGYRYLGTGSIQSSGSTIFGTGTNFDTELRVGSEIIVNRTVRRVDQILGPEQITINSAFESDLASSEFWYTHRLVVVDDQGRMRLGQHEGAPEEQLHVDGNIKLSGSIVSDNDICIGICP